jgi:hypothetical protein
VFEKSGRLDLPVILVNGEVVIEFDKSYLESLLSWQASEMEHGRIPNLYFPRVLRNIDPMWCSVVRRGPWSELQFW